MISCHIVFCRCVQGFHYRARHATDMYFGTGWCTPAEADYHTLFISSQSFWLFILSPKPVIISINLGIVYSFDITDLIRSGSEAYPCHKSQNSTL